MMSSTAGKIYIICTPLLFKILSILTITVMPSWFIHAANYLVGATIISALKANLHAAARLHFTAMEQAYRT